MNLTLRINFLRITSAAIVLAGMLSACQPLPSSAYRLPVTPESLIEASAEKVSFAVTTPKSVQELTAWINKDQPARAEVACVKNDMDCRRALQVLSSFSVPFKMTTPKNNTSTVALIYDRKMTRKCNNTYIENHHNEANLNDSAFGCSVASNTVKMLSDPQELTNPLVLGHMDAK